MKERVPEALCASATEAPPGPVNKRPPSDEEPVNPNSSALRVPSPVQGWDANCPWVRAMGEAAPLPVKSH